MALRFSRIAAFSRYFTGALAWPFMQSGTRLPKLRLSNYRHTGTCQATILFVHLVVLNLLIKLLSQRDGRARRRFRNPQNMLEHLA